jgi:transcriptional enhancer factor
MDSETTLVDYDNTVANIDHFFPTANSGTGDYDHNAASWVLPVTESFDADPVWANYTVPSSTPAMGWVGDGKKKYSWVNDAVSEADVNGKQIGWSGEAEGERHEWGNGLGKRSPVKAVSYVEGIEQKLGAWIEENGDGEENGHYDEVSDLDNEYVEIGQLDGGADGNGNDVVDGVKDEKEQMREWDVVDDGFDYESLAARLKV